MVIVILGILSAIALPRYIDVQRDARIAVVKTVLGTLQSAAMLMRVRCELDIASTKTGCTGTLNSSISTNGTSIQMRYKYPAAASTGITAATSIDYNQYRVAGGGSTGLITIGIYSAPIPTQCQVAYYEAISATAEPVIKADFSGC